MSASRRRSHKYAQGYQVLPSGKCRIRLAGHEHEPLLPNESAAMLRVAELKAAKEKGVVVPPAPGARLVTLGERAQITLNEKLAVGGRNGELTAAGAKHYRYALKPWIEGPLAHKPLRTLTRAELQKTVNERARHSRVAARNEAQALLLLLKEAQMDDIEFPFSLLGVTVPKKTKRSRPDLKPSEFDFMLAFIDERVVRVFQLASTLGNRVSELLYLERQWIDLDARVMTLPSWATKEKWHDRGKRLFLTDEECDILREQLLDVYSRLGSDSRFVFPRPMGGRYDYDAFYESVWEPAKVLAQVAWLTEREGIPKAREVLSTRRSLTKTIQQGIKEGTLKPEAEAKLREEIRRLPATPFDLVTLHTLRRTAVSWLRRSGLPVEIIAQRLGHSDKGATLLADYRVDAEEADVRAALDGLGHGVRAKLDEIGGKS